MRTLTALSLIFTLAACGTAADSAAPVTATAEAARVSPQDLAQLQAQVARLRAEIRAMEGIVSPRDAASGLPTGRTIRDDLNDLDRRVSATDEVVRGIEHWGDPHEYMVGLNRSGAHAGAAWREISVDEPGVNRLVEADLDGDGTFESLAMALDEDGDGEVEIAPFSIGEPGVQIAAPAPDAPGR